MKILTGKSILDQVAYGPLRVYHRQPFQLDFLSHLSSGDEVLRFQTAQRRAVLQLADLYDQAALVVGPQAASIFAIHAMLLEDTSFVDSILSIIQTQYTTAEYAVQVAGTSYSAAFAAMENPYMAARGADLRDISNRMIRLLLGEKIPDPLGNRPAILVSDELLPSEVLALDRKKLLGLVTWHGSVDSHTAMLLRLLNIPGLAQANISQDCDGHQAILDGFSQNLYLDPDKQLVTDMGFEPKKGKLPPACWPPSSRDSPTVVRFPEFTRKRYPGAYFSAPGYFGIFLYSTAGRNSIFQPIHRRASFKGSRSAPHHRPLHRSIPTHTRLSAALTPPHSQ